MKRKSNTSVSALDVGGNPGRYFIIRRDRCNPNQIYIEAPRFSVLDEASAIDLCNRVTELLERTTDDD